MPFKELEHTADVLMRVWAPTQDRLFSESASALFSVIFCNAQDKGVEIPFSVEADDPDSLLHDFLSELIYLADVEGAAFSHAEVTIQGGSLDAVVHGEPFSQERHAGGTEVKGISYSGMHIIHNDDHFAVDILFDV